MDNMTTPQKIKAILPYIMLMGLFIYVGAGSSDVLTRTERTCIEEARQTLEEAVEHYRAHTAEAKRVFEGEGESLETLRSVSATFRFADQKLGQAVLTFDAEKEACEGVKLSEEASS